MLLDIVKKGSTDRGVTLRIIDSTDGSPETGVVYNTSGIDLWYRRQGGAKVSITEATLSALTDAHSDGGFLHIADGVYRLDLPDAAFASGAQWVDVGGTVTGMIVIGGRVRLVDLDLETVIANQVWDALLSGHTTPSSMAIYLASLVAGQTTIATQTAPSGIQGSVGLAAANLATLLAAIQAAADNAVTAAAAAAVSAGTAVTQTTAVEQKANVGEALETYDAATATDVAAATVLTDIDGEKVSASRTFRLVRTDADGLEAEVNRSLSLSKSATFAFDFSDDLPANGFVRTVGTPTIYVGTSGGVTFGDAGRYGAQAKVRITAVTAGTYTIACPVTYNDGSTAVGYGTLVVPAAP